MEKPLKFRPHHFLCTLAFEGKGYSPDYVKNFYRIVRDLDQAQLEVVLGFDAICEPCPHHGTYQCTFEDKVSQLDQAHAEILGLKPGDQLTWAAAKERLKQHMTLERFHQACASCSWKALGVCEAHLKALHQE